MATTITDQQAELLKRVNEYSFDAPGARQTFADRLAKENGWSSDFTTRVIEEYRRFAFIFAAAEHPVAPSDAVDQAWHLHLLYTRTYWSEFCQKVLGKPLHHEPANGAEGEGAKLADWYTHTYESYRRFFGEPPADIWPWPQELQRSPKHQHRRVDTSTSFILPRSVAWAILLVVTGLWIAVLVIGLVLNRS